MKRRIAAILLLVPTLVNAEMHDDADIFTLDLEALLNIQIVTPQATDTTLKNAPAAISVFSQEDIRRLGVTYLHQLVNLVPGYSSYRLANSGTHYSLVSRGFKTGSASREVLVLWNGVRLNSDATGGYQFSNRQLSLENVKRVEFLRGPASTIYGSNAFLGVVNIITDHQSFAELRVGENSSRSLVVSASVPMKVSQHQFFAKYDSNEGQPLATYDGATSQWLDNRDPFTNKEAYWQFESDYVDTMLRWVSRESTDFYVNSRAGFDANRWHSQNWLASINWQSSLTHSIDARVQLLAKREDAEISRTEQLQPLRWSRNEFTNDEFGITARIDSTKADRKWFAGLEIRRATINKADLFPNGTVDFHFPVAEATHRIIKGIFAEYDGHINEQFNYVFGARWDSYSEGSRHLSPRLAMIYHLSNQQTIKLLADEAFRAPTRIEKDPVDSPRLVGNPDLMPEVARNLELVYLWQTENDLLSSSLFSTHISDIISTVQLAGSNALTRVNRDKVNIAGIEVEWQKNWTGKLHSRMVGTWLFDSAHDPSPESDKLFSLSVSYSLQKTEWNLVANYQGARDNFDQFSPTRFPIAGRTLVNANWRYFISNKCNLSIRLTNLFDKAYVSPSQNNFVPFGIPGRGRELDFGIQIDF